MILPVEKKLDRYCRLEHFNEDSNNFITINLQLGTICNFACSYCPVEFHDGKFLWPKLKIMKDFIDEIFLNMAYKNKEFLFYFTGGEPTLWKNLPEIARYIKEHHQDVGIISNSSRTLRWWEDNHLLFDLIILSYHPEFMNSKKFLTLVKFLTKNHIIHINVMMHNNPKYWSLGVDMVDSLIEDIGNITMAIRPLREEFSKPVLREYTSDQITYMKNQNERKKNINLTLPLNKPYRGPMVFYNVDSSITQKMINQEAILYGMNNFYGWNCRAGLDQIFIDYDGSVYRGYCQQGGKIGNILEPEKIDWPNDTIKCGSKACLSGPDFAVPKYR